MIRNNIQLYKFWKLGKLGHNLELEWRERSSAPWWTLTNSIWIFCFKHWRFKIVRRSIRSDVQKWSPIWNSLIIKKHLLRLFGMFFSFSCFVQKYNNICFVQKFHNFPINFLLLSIFLTKVVLLSSTKKKRIYFYNFATFGISFEI